MRTYLQNRKRSTDLENEFMIARGRLEGRDSQGVWDGHVHIAIFKMDNQQDLLYSAWNSAQSYVAVWMGWELGEEWILVYVWLSPFNVPLNLSQQF